jgi:hypothetical protein
MTSQSPENSWGSSSKSDDADKTRSENLVAALSELLGKQFDRPSARSVGKLFQKRLVGRPTWIKDGQTIATLRRFAGHGENTYRVEVIAAQPSFDAGLDNTLSGATQSEKHSPLSPQSPRSRSSEVGSGNVGNAGNVIAAEVPRGSSLSSTVSAVPPAPGEAHVVAEVETDPDPWDVQTSSGWKGRI